MLLSRHWSHESCSLERNLPSILDVYHNPHINYRTLATTTTITLDQCARKGWEIVQCVISSVRTRTPRAHDNKSRLRKRNAELDIHVALPWLLSHIFINLWNLIQRSVILPNLFWICCLFAVDNDLTEVAHSLDRILATWKHLCK